jgi:hypothetical protein
MSCNPDYPKEGFPMESYRVVFIDCSEGNYQEPIYTKMSVEDEVQLKIDMLLGKGIGYYTHD